MLRALGEAMVGWARRAAEAALGDALPRRWAHSQGVAALAAEVGKILGKDVDVQTAAGVHDVGYAPQLTVTGFHV